MYRRRAASMASGLEVSSCRGRPVTAWMASTVWVSTAGSSRPGRPTFTSRHVGPGLLLLEGFVQHIVHVPRPRQGSLELLLPGGVDALPDDHRFLTQHHRSSVGGDNGICLPGRQPCFHSPAQAGHLPDVSRGSATAAADRAGPHLHDPPHGSGKFLRGNIIHGAAVSLSGQACIWLDDYRQRGILHDLLQDGKHLLRSQSAVDAKSIHPEAFQHGDSSCHISACQELPFLVKDHGGKDREGGVLFRPQHSGFHLIHVAHRLDVDKIGTGGLPVPGGLPESCQRGLKIQISQRL